MYRLAGCLCLGCGMLIAHPGFVARPMMIGFVCHLAVSVGFHAHGVDVHPFGCVKHRNLTTLPVAIFFRRKVNQWQWVKVAAIHQVFPDGVHQQIRHGTFNGIDCQLAPAIVLAATDTRSSFLNQRQGKGDIVDQLAGFLM